MNLDIKDLDSEELYQLIKTQIKNQNENSNIKKSGTQDYTHTQEEIYCAKKFISFDKNNLSEWVSSSFDTYLNEKKILSPEINGNWGTEIMTQKRAGTEIQNLIFCSNEGINYKIVNNTLKSTVILKGDSDYWIFLHSKGKLDDETIVILFSKTEFSDIVYMSLGLFIKSNDNDDNEENNDSTNNKFYFRIFQTMQLIRSYNRNQTDNYKYESSDSCLIKILVLDEGKESIKVSAWLNEGDAENILIGNFYKQVFFNYGHEKRLKISSTFESNNKNYKVMIAGSGAQCKVTQFSCETSFKDNYEYIEGCKQGFNSCNYCCIVI